MATRLPADWAALTVFAASAPAPLMVLAHPETRRAAAMARIGTRRDGFMDGRLRSAMMTLGNELRGKVVP